jgi:hypothetical protein
VFNVINICNVIVGGAIGNPELTNRFGELEKQGKCTRTKVGKGGVVLILVVSEGKERKGKERKGNGRKGYL